MKRTDYAEIVNMGELEAKANHYTVRCQINSFLILTAVWLLNVFDIFIIDSHLMNLSYIPSVFSSIFKSAFDFRSMGGGVIGFLSSRALRFGTMRGLLSNEAGCGTAPTAHAAADVKSPAEQGFWGIFEVFVDTVLLCTMTAVVIILNYGNVSHLGGNPIMMAIKAYSATLGSWSDYLLSASVSVFGIATVICWAHYGAECIRYLFPKKRKIFSFLYLLLYASVTVMGAVIAPESVWGLADLSLGALTIINAVILIFNRKEIAYLTDNFFKRV